MNISELNTIESLIENPSPPCISIYMPAIRSGKEVKQNAIRFKNLVGKAEDKLRNTGLKDREINPLLQPVKDMIDDNLFWQHQDQGLALCLSKDSGYYFKLPYEPNEYIHLGDQFYIKPLIKALTENKIFYLLALSQNNLRLYRCTRYQIEQIDLPKVPTSIEEMLQYEDPEKSLQYHTGTAGAGKRSAVFHGQGTGSDASRHKKDIQRFFNMADNRLRENGYYQKMDDDNAMLILIGLEELTPLYKEANTYGKLFDKTIDKNPDDLKDDVLQQTGWAVMSTIIEQEKHNLLNAFFEKRGGQKTSVDCRDIVKSAVNQRVDALFINPEANCRGYYDPDQNNVTIDENAGQSIELINFAAIETLKHNGRVIILEKEKLPEDSPVAAIYRF